MRTGTGLPNADLNQTLVTPPVKLSFSVMQGPQAPQCHRLCRIMPFE